MSRRDAFPVGDYGGAKVVGLATEGENEPLTRPNRTALAKMGSRTHRPGAGPSRGATDGQDSGSDPSSPFLHFNDFVDFAEDP
ncbi:hypothetical protein U1Q18_007820 [Sarracenia purpurea var. burkii]